MCRFALGARSIDPASYSTIRLASGAVALCAIVAARGKSRAVLRSGSVRSAFLLYLYAVPFSFAYVTLSASTGALILFASVQATMITAALVAGERPRPIQWAGFGAAVAGLAYLVRPGLTAPSPLGSALMALAGVAWGVYSLRGRGSANPLADTASNFLRAVPMAAATSFLTLRSAHLSSNGVALALASGVAASGAGYAVWYAVLPRLTATRAASVQLAVPVLAAAASAALLGERITPRLVAASLAILGGLSLALLGRERTRRV